MKKTKIFILLCIIGLAAVLRFYQLGRNPPSLYWDEVSLGYNAYSILTTGRDEHGEWFPTTRFIAFGDYKPPGYIYAAVPSIALFGLTEFAVRFPSAFFGTLAIMITYFLTKLLLVKSTKNNAPWIGLMSSLLLAISPWHIQLSRGAFEGNLAMFFNLLGVCLFIYSIHKKKWLLPISVLFFVLSFYTFNSNRIIAPLLGVFLGLVYWKNLWQEKKILLFSIIFGFILMFPNIAYLQTRESRLRFQEVSILTNLAPLITSNTRITQDNSVLWARLLHNRRIVYFREFLMRYVDHFKGEFLFIRGDRNPRLSAQSIGELYMVELPFLLIGLYFLLARRTKEDIVLVGWLFIAPIPAAIARETPHALRIISILPTIQIIVASGFLESLKLIKRGKKLFMGFITLLLLLNILYYLHNYYVHYPIIWSGEWQYGYKEMVVKVSALESRYDHVVVTNSLGRPYIYFLFYQKISPEVFWTNKQADRDWAGLWTVNGFGKYDFDLASIPKLEGKILVVAKPSEMPTEARILDEVKQLNGETVFEIGEL